MNLDRRRRQIENRFRSAGSASYALRLKPKSLTVPGLVPARVVVVRAVFCRPSFMSSCGPTHSQASITPRSKAPKMSPAGVTTASRPALATTIPPRPAIRIRSPL